MARTFRVSIPDNANVAEERGAFVFPPGTVVSETTEPGSTGRPLVNVPREFFVGVEGPSETFAASAPRQIIAAVRERNRGRGAFSRFIARAIANELVDEQRRELLAGMVADGAEIDADLSDRLQVLFARPDR
jgi:hypothetical protein